MTNNKQQTAVKLYTEEQVIKMLDLARFTYNSEDKILLSQIPIELPTDEEIDYAETQMPMNTFELGAKWMRDKIQGGKQ
jgi:hypothetical protein